MALAEADLATARGYLVEAERERHIPCLIRSLLDLVAAQLDFASGDRHAARARLALCFRVLAAGGVLSMFYLLPDEDLGWLCGEALREGVEATHVRRMIRCRDLRPGAAPTDIPGWPWPVAVRVLGAVDVDPPITHHLQFACAHA